MVRGTPPCRSADAGQNCDSSDSASEAISKPRLHVAGKKCVAHKSSFDPICVRDFLGLDSGTDASEQSSSEVCRAGTAPPPSRIVFDKKAWAAHAGLGFDSDSSGDEICHRLDPVGIDSSRQAKNKALAAGDSWDPCADLTETKIVKSAIVDAASANFAACRGKTQDTDFPVESAVASIGFDAWDPFADPADIEDAKPVGRTVQPPSISIAKTTFVVVEDPPVAATLGGPRWAQKLQQCRRCSASRGVLSRAENATAPGLAAFLATLDELDSKEDSRRSAHGTRASDFLEVCRLGEPQGKATQSSSSSSEPLKARSATLGLENLPSRLDAEDDAELGVGHYPERDETPVGVVPIAIGAGPEPSHRKDEGGPGASRSSSALLDADASMPALNSILQQLEQEEQSGDSQRLFFRTEGASREGHASCMFWGASTEHGTWGAQGSLAKLIKNSGQSMDIVAIRNLDDNLEPNDSCRASTSGASASDSSRWLLERPRRSLGGPDPAPQPSEGRRLPLKLRRGAT